MRVRERISKNVCVCVCVCEREREIAAYKRHMETTLDPIFVEDEHSKQERFTAVVANLLHVSIFWMAGQSVGNLACLTTVLIDHNLECLLLQILL